MHHVVTTGRRLLAIGVLAIATGCTVRSGPPVADAYVYAGTSVPARVYAGPRAYYGGTTYYYADDHWWYRGPRGWYYLRHEPPELQRYRPGVAQPPPAYGGGPPVHVAPPAPAPR